MEYDGTSSVDLALGTHGDCPRALLRSRFSDHENIHTVLMIR